MAFYETYEEFEQQSLSAETETVSSSESLGFNPVILQVT